MTLHSAVDELRGGAVPVGDDDATHDIIPMQELSVASKRRPFIDRQHLARANFVARLYDQLQSRPGALAERLDNTIKRASGNIEG